MSTSASRRDASGLRRILFATAVSGAMGYLIQFAVPLFAPDSYLTFATTWSAVFLVGACLSGIQQELTRASRPRTGDLSHGFRRWAVFAVTAAALAGAVVAVVFAVLGERIFPAHTAMLVGVVAAAAFGYALTAALGGALYGVRNWNAASGMTIVDALLRAGAVGLVLLAGGGVVPLGWAIAAPFLVSAAVIAVATAAPLREDLHLDAGLAVLSRNVASTLVASLSMGVLISGLPLLLRTFAADIGEATLAAVILVITLTRAPVIIPLMALQSYLLVMFRDRTAALTRSVVVWSAAVVVGAAALSLLAAGVGPTLMALIFPDFAPLPGGLLAGIVMSAGLTGVLCITGPALLAHGRHRWYVAGWLAGAVVTAACLLSPAAPTARILIALAAGALAGILVHAVGMFGVGRPGAPRPQGEA